MRAGIGGDEVIDDGDLGVFLGDHEGVREDGGAGAGRDVRDDDGRWDFDAAGDVDERAVADESGVQRGEFRRAEFLRLRHEVLAEEIRVLRGSVGEGGDDDAGGKGSERGRLGGDGVVDEGQRGGVGAKGGVGTSVRSARKRAAYGRNKIFERQSADGAEAPGFVGALRQRERREFFVGGALAIEPPRGGGRLRRKLRGEGLGREGADEGFRFGESGSGHLGIFDFGFSIFDWEPGFSRNRKSRIQNRKSRGHQPTEPSISRSMRRLSSTLYSMGNWRARSLIKPFTARLIAWPSVRPRCCM